MRRIAMVVGLSTLLLAMVVGVAVSVEKFCDEIPCRGTENDDRLEERRGDHERDRILGLDGADVIDASTYNRDRDVAEGGNKGDDIFTDDRDGKDTARGGRGDDRCVADPGDSVSSCRRVNPASVEAQKMADAASSAGVSADGSGETTSP